IPAPRVRPSAAQRGSGIGSSMINHKTVIRAACSAAVVAMSATAQQWEVFLDSDGFEELPLGVMPSSGYEMLLPHVLAGGGSGFPAQLPEVVSLPDPVIDGQSIRLEARFRRAGDALTEVRWGHRTEKLAKP